MVPDLTDHQDLRRHSQDLASDRLDARSRQARRYLLLQAGAEAALAGDDERMRASRQIALDGSLQRSDDWLATVGALEALPAGGAPWRGKCVLTDDAIEQSVARILPEMGGGAFGSDLEPKFRFAGLDLQGDVLRFSLACTTWTMGRSFHAEFARNPGRFLQHDGQRLIPLPLGNARLPGLAVVHCVVLTSDAKVLIALRGANVAYAPLHWSVSFEEQLTAADVQKGDEALHFAAQRGMMEEFGIMVPLSEIHLMSALLQMDNGNLGVVVALRAPQRFTEIERRWSADPKPSHFWEAASVACINADPRELLELANADESLLGPLHPTSALRCAIVSRWLRSLG